MRFCRSSICYLRGISTGDFQEALAAILGKDAPNLSPGVISRPAWSRIALVWVSRPMILNGC